MKTRNLSVVVMFFFTTISLSSQSTPSPINENDSQKLNTYLIERNIPGAGQLTSEQLQGISRKSCDVLDEMGPKIEWVHSYVTENKVYCLYKAENEELIRKHAEKGGFPVNNVTLLSNVISPETAIKKE